MIRTLSLAILATLVFCSQASAIFIIDSFHRVDLTANDGNSVLVHAAGGGNIFVEATTSGSMLFSSADQAGYFLQGGAAGDSFTLAYTWDVPTFNDLQSVSGNQISSIPQAFVGGWDLEIDGGALGNLYSGSSLGAPGVPIDIDGATQLAFTFTWQGTGFGFGQFGGPGSPFIATPEPTAALMLGSVVFLGLSRRRRQ